MVVNEAPVLAVKEERERRKKTRNEPLFYMRLNRCWKRSQEGEAADGSMESSPDKANCGCDMQRIDPTAYQNRRTDHPSPSLIA